MDNSSIRKIFAKLYYTRENVDLAGMDIKYVILIQDSPIRENTNELANS